VVVSLGGFVLVFAVPESLGMVIPPPVDAGLPQAMLVCAPVAALAGLAFAISAPGGWSDRSRLAAIGGSLVALIVTLALAGSVLTG
jgi:hypothetical protein